MSAAPHGSPGILPISWAYIRMMGSEGLRQATAAAVLAANYIAARLRDHYPVLYTGEGGLVAHECILDLRPLREATGVTVDDVAKRLIDYGFHAPTMSFPVAGTLMVEPTESRGPRRDRPVHRRDDRDQGRGGCGRRGTWPADDNPLRERPAHGQVGDRGGVGAPVLAVRRPCTRCTRCVRNKYWPPVRRIDQAYGDRNLVCACPPIEAFE